MNRIDNTLEALRLKQKKMLSPYITAGDPSPTQTVALMHALVAAGADIIELGIPFSDPMAEGPVIQRAMERALAHGVHTKQVLDMVREFRQKDMDTPIILMGYLNPIEYYGYEAFAKDAVQAGVDGTIMVDLPPEESHELAKIWQEQGLYNIYLCSPTTSNDRMALINSVAKGYLYYVSLTGVTGSTAPDLKQVKAQYEERKALCDLPLMVGFGIKTPEMAAAITDFADGAIVGAALIQSIHDAFVAKSDCFDAAKLLIGGMRQAMDTQA